MEELFSFLVPRCKAELYFSLDHEVNFLKISIRNELMMVHILGVKTKKLETFKFTLCFKAYSLC